MAGPLYGRFEVCNGEKQSVILSTPVIDLATRTLYCVSTSSVDGTMGKAVYHRIRRNPRCRH
jgi:hypothetical protein